MVGTPAVEAIYPDVDKHDLADNRLRLLPLPLLPGPLLWLGSLGGQGAHDSSTAAGVLQGQRPAVPSRPCLLRPVAHGGAGGQGSILHNYPLMCYFLKNDVIRVQFLWG